MATTASFQWLVSRDTSPNIAEALAARTKDPLWFLARQWQTGEFEAENGGRPGVLSIVTRETPIDRIDRGGTVEALPADKPMDWAVEREADDGTSPAWKEQALEYAFAVEGGGTRLVASEYHGRSLDWHHFDIQTRPSARAGPTTEWRMIPTTLHFRGAPHPRWWRFEDGDAYFDSPRDPEPNILSTLLPEFFLIDINNWYLAPLPQIAGTIREIVSLDVIDSFGVVTRLAPSTGTGDPDWAMFSLASATDSGPNDGGGAFLYIPNIAVAVLDNDEVEEVVFTRDEEANLVWAQERLVTLTDGTIVRNGDRPTAPPSTAPTPSQTPPFRLRSDVPPHFIPYVPRRVNLTPTSAEIYLRRGRTVETATPAAPQYRGRIVRESWRIDEAEVPRTGIRVRRTRRYARGSDGTGLFWIGRDRRTAPRPTAPTLHFDYLEEHGI